MEDKKVSFETLGCRLNIAETGSLKELFSAKGFSIVPFGEEAHVVVINTCTVTDGADHTCRNTIRKAKKISPLAKIVVIGCYAQVASEEISKIEGVDLILGNSEKHKILEYLEEEEQFIKIDRSHDFWMAATSLSDEHTRAFLKIQDGCNYVCAYCIIPFARGPSKAISTDIAAAKARELADNGFKEIVLAGVNIGEYQGLTGESLSTLTKKLLEIENLKRLRFSSIEPNTVTDELISVWKSSPKIMDYFHLPLQSGDDGILKMMRRKYSSLDYEKVVLKLKEHFPHAGIGADVIVGFPSETENQFENTYKLMEKLPLSHFHVFPYSKRKGTTASTLKDQISSEIKKRRVQKLIELGERKMKEFISSQVQKETTVLFETQDKDGFFGGHSSNFIPVKVRSEKNLKNEIVKVIFCEARDSHAFVNLQPS